jgi:predicted HTH transcriptional regulator
MRGFEGGVFDESRIKDYPTGEILERHLMLATNNGDELLPTVAGLLLFGRDQSVAKLLPRASVIATRFSGDTSQAPVIERIELQGNLATIYESALRFTSRYVDLLDSRPARLTNVAAENAPVPARANYHRGVVAEAIANALTHRDLALRDITTRLHIFDRSIEIANPRRSAGFAPAALKAIRYGVPARLNPQVAAMFTSPAYGLSLPSGGLPKLLREARSFSNRLPEIVAFNDEFRLRLHGI